jgi:hypothetical protein
MGELDETTRGIVYTEFVAMNYEFCAGYLSLVKGKKEFPVPTSNSSEYHLLFDLVLREEYLPRVMSPTAFM